MKDTESKGPAEPTRRERMRAWVHAKLTDRLMVELAVLLIPVALLPLWFTFSPVAHGLLQLVNGAIIAVFALEYGLKLFVAESRWRFMRDPWRLLDLTVVLCALVDLLPFIPWQGGRASPVLRLLRLLRFFALTGRTLRRAAPAVRPVPPAAASEPTRIRISEEQAIRRDATWADAGAAVLDPRQTWVDVQGVRREELDDIARAFQLPRQVLESKLFHDPFPGIDCFREYTVFVLWDIRMTPAEAEPARLRTEEGHIVVICGNDYLATVSTGHNDLFERLGAPGSPLTGESFIARVLLGMVQRMVAAYKDIVQTLELQVAEQEEVPGRTASPAFLEHSFHLKKLIQRQDYNLRHFSQVLGRLSTRKVALAGISDADHELFALLRDEAEALTETCHAIRDNLVSIIELQLNKVSFDLNRVMRILAVISCLSLVPAIIGGMLGENLVDQPYNLRIGEVFFIVGSVMLTGLYVFMRKGWLK